MGKKLKSKILTRDWKKVDFNHLSLSKLILKYNSSRLEYCMHQCTKHRIWTSLKFRLRTSNIPTQLNELRMHANKNSPTSFAIASNKSMSTSTTTILNSNKNCTNGKRNLLIWKIVQIKMQKSEKEKTEDARKNVKSKTKNTSIIRFIFVCVFFFKSRVEEYYTQRKRCQLTRWRVDQHSSSVRSLIAAAAALFGLDNGNWTHSKSMQNAQTMHNRSGEMHNQCAFTGDRWRRYPPLHSNVWAKSICFAAKIRDKMI